jgi:hypothetical protein
LPAYHWHKALSTALHITLTTTTTSDTITIITITNAANIFGARH